MNWIIFFSLLAGGLSGYFFKPLANFPYFDQVTTAALCVLLVGVGIDLGRNRELLTQLKAMGYRIALLPVYVAVGSILGAVVGGMLLGMPLNEASAIGAGFGWYSLSGVLLAQIYSVQVGTLAFLANVWRELLAILLIPQLARYCTNRKMIAIVPGGATTMDVTLPIVARYLGSEMSVVAFLHGAILTALVPILIPLLIKL